MAQERRAFLRKVVSAPATFRVANGEQVSVLSHDVGRGGCFLATQALVAAGERIELEIRFSDGSTVQGAARVIWVREVTVGKMLAGMGVAFVDLSADALTTIGKIVAAPAVAARARTVIGVAPPARASAPEAPEIAAPKDAQPAREEELSWSELPSPEAAKPEAQEQTEPTPALEPAPAAAPAEEPKAEAVRSVPDDFDPLHPKSEPPGPLLPQSEPPAPLEIPSLAPPPPPVEAPPPPQANAAAEDVLTDVDVHGKRNPPPENWPLPKSPWAERKPEPFRPALGGAPGAPPTNPMVRWIAAAVVGGVLLLGVVLAFVLGRSPSASPVDASAADLALPVIAPAEAAPEDEEDALAADANQAVDAPAPQLDATVRDAASVDAGKDAGRDAGKDAGKDAGRDAGKSRDAGKDAGKPKPKK